MNNVFNRKVVTPIGKGDGQGLYGVENEQGVVIAVHGLVRMKITDETVKHLRDANCLTPGASVSGLWHFPLEV